MSHDWMAVNGGPQATVCHMWCAKCGTLWAVADPHEPERTNRYFVAGWAFEADGLARPEGGLPDEPECPPRVVRAEITVSAPPPSQDS
jgi:hypothetical protein